ncbi:MAG: hypothetical protein GF334_12700 [Candidatus Altiarchaeales archaeon]|nr:hypothetical protein [Candidatus Altiarchaeales archaeon]
MKTLPNALLILSVFIILGCLTPKTPETGSNHTSTTTTPTSTTPAFNTPPTTTSSTSTSTSLVVCGQEKENPPRFIELQVTHVGDCMNTPRGKMNTVIAEAESKQIMGTWGSKPNPKIYYHCGGGRKILFDWMLLKGGSNIGAHENLSNTYRLAARCGRNQLTYDLSECENLTVFLDAAYTDATYIEGLEAAERTYGLKSTTTTTLKHNPYLDRFRNQSLRMAKFDLAWMCPSCVPAVNKMFMQQQGVKSQSLGYKQGLCYVIYDPEVIDLDRIMMLANAGGTPTLINDTKL